MKLSLRSVLHQAVAALVLVAPSAFAVTVPDLYEVIVPAGANRDSAFAEALKVVVVRVSGRRDAAGRLGANASSPRQYVQRFGLTSDNQLQVGFDGVAVERLLSDVGLPIWGRERPATLVLLNVEAADGSARWIDARTATVEREILVKAAAQRGLPLIWPDAVPVLSAEPAAASADLMRIATEHGANASLLGRARRGADGSYAVSWSLTSEEGSNQASGSLEDGVHLAADSLARVYSASGSSLVSVVVEVSGIDNLSAYATTLNYLEGMTLVRGTALENVTGDIMRLRLAVRGDATTLRRALALDNRLVPLEQTSGMAAADRVQLRYRP